MPFGVVSVVCRGMGVLDEGGDRRRGRGSFLWDGFGASHCNQWGLCDALFSNYFGDLLIPVAELENCDSVMPLVIIGLVTGF